MKNRRVCFIYPWATFGGVERVLLNRALAFKHFVPSVTLDFLFLHDAGGLRPLASAISKYGLEANSAIVSSLEREYDLVFAIDCPQAIDMCERQSQRYLVECHTAYSENRRYLANLPKSCERVITPSAFFSEIIRKEYPRMPSPISELRNFIPWDIDVLKENSETCLPKWTRKPILFFGRLDKLKDPLSLLDAYECLEKTRSGEFMLLFCGPDSPEIDLQKEITKRSLDGVTVRIPAIPFASAGRLFASVAQLGGVFVSPSKGESFGLSAAEAISSLVPVVLSDIDAHVGLVTGFEEELTYPVGDYKSMARRIEAVFDNYSAAQEAVAIARNKFSAHGFIQDWATLFEELDIN